MLLLSCDLKRRRGSDFIARGVLFADYFPKMLGRISIACDEKSRQVPPRTEAAARVGAVPPGIHAPVQAGPELGPALCLGAIRAAAGRRWSLGAGERLSGWAKGCGKAGDTGE